MRVARVDSQQGCAYSRAEARAGDPYEAVYAPQGQRDEGLQMWRSRCNSGRDCEKNRWHPNHHLSGHEGSCESAATHERGHDTTGAKLGRGPVSERVCQHVLAWLPPFSERSGIQPRRALKRVVARPLSYDEEVLPVRVWHGYLDTGRYYTEPCILKYMDTGYSCIVDTTVCNTCTLMVSTILDTVSQYCVIL